jgi:hypothetical protein
MTTIDALEMNRVCGGQDQVTTWTDDGTMKGRTFNVYRCSQPTGDDPRPGTGMQLNCWGGASATAAWEPFHLRQVVPTPSQSDSQ